MSVCKRKLQSKEEALRILKSELDNEREQKEHYKHVISIMVLSVCVYVCMYVGINLVHVYVHARMQSFKHLFQQVGGGKNGATQLEELSMEVIHHQ